MALLLFLFLSIILQGIMIESRIDLSSLDNEAYKRLVTIEVGVGHASLLKLYSAEKETKRNEEEMDEVIKRLILNALTNESTVQTTLATTTQEPIDQDPGASKRKRSLRKRIDWNKDRKKSTNNSLSKTERDGIVKREVHTDIKLDEIEIVKTDGDAQGIKEFVTFYIKNTDEGLSTQEIVTALTSRSFKKEFQKELGAEVTDVYAGIPRIEKKNWEIIFIVVIVLLLLLVVILLLLVCLKRKGKITKPFANRLEKINIPDQCSGSNTIKDGDIIPINNLM